jgi:RecA-family ATPase
MYAPDQLIYANQSSGEPLPSVWPSLGEKGVIFERSQVVLICAPPGAGKSAFVLNYALKSRVPTLYFSADSSPTAQLARTISILTGMKLDRAAEIARSKDLSSVGRRIQRAGPDNPSGTRVEFVCTQLDLKQIETSIQAYGEFHEDFPEFIVVDNITDVFAGGANDDDPFAGLEVTMEALRGIARDYEACVVGLHHVTGSYNDGGDPIPLSGIKGQIARVPELVLTMHRSDHYGAQQLRVSTVKNRAGVADPSGLGWVGLDFQGETMTIKDRA